MIALLAVAPAMAAPAEWPLLPTLAEWADRSVAEQELDGQRPSRARIATYDRDAWFVQASMGALLSDQGWRTRPGRVEVVVGDDRLDSARFDWRGDLPTVGETLFVVDDVPIAIARDLWLATDASFKAAVTQYQVKTAALSQLGGAYPPDWSPAPVVQSVDVQPLPALQADVLRDIALSASGALHDLGGLRNGRVSANARAGHYVMVDAEGTRLVEPEHSAVVYAWADVVRDDGVQVYEYAQWVARTTADLPPRDEIVAAVEALGRRVLARRDAPVVTYYEGPVVFEDAAAADVFRYLAMPELLGTPPEPQPDRTYERLIRTGPRLGRRLLERGWSVWDDPGAAPAGLAGGFTHDREGVRAERVELVVDGVVRDLLMTRVPRHDLMRSNGHCRGDVQGVWEARESVWSVEPARRLSDRAFDRAVERARRAAGLESVLVVRGFERGREGGLPRTTNAVWRHPDGAETPVLELDFEHDDRRLLRDILAAAGKQTVPYLAPERTTRTAEGTSGLPAIAITPRRLLVGELEAVFPGGNVEPHVVPPP